MKITLYKDWDSLPSGLAKPSPYFSGRTKELAQLEHILLNKTSGSILIGAPRGVGKTDLVYKAISEVLSNKTRPQLIPIIVNATQINEVKGTEKLAQAIITNLITRTYATTKGKVSEKLLKKIATLYYQATSKTYEERTTILGKNEAVEKETKTYERISLGKLSLNKKDLENAIKNITPIGTVSIILLLHQLQTIPFWAIIPTYIVLFIITVLSQAIDFSIQTNETNKKLIEKSTNESIVEQAEVLYLRDNSFGNLENGLKEILQEIQDSKQYKVVFVIDELDKVKFQSEPSEILEMIQIFKGLFNHSDALFLFISDLLVFEAANLSREKRKTSIHSTLFTERIYITRPTIADLKEYLKKITLKHDGDDESLDAFTDLVIFKSRMDFFKLPDNIRDYEDSYQNGNPILNWTKNSENLQKVNKQKIITALLEDGNYLYTELSNRQKNEELIETLYDIAEKTSPFEIPKIPDDPNPQEKTRLQLELDTANLLYRAGIFQRAELSRMIPTTTPTGTATMEKEFFSYTPTSSVGKTLTKLNDPLEYEIEFLEKFESFDHFILRIYNFRAELLKLKTENSVTDAVLQDVSRISGLLPDLYKSQKSIYEQLKNNPAKHDSTQEYIKALINQINKHCEEIVKNNSLLIIKNVLEELKLPVWDLHQSRDFLDMLPYLRDHIFSKSIPNIILRTQKRSKDVTTIFLLNPADTIANNKDAFEELRKYKRAYVVEFHTSDTIPNISDDKGNKFEAVVNNTFDITSKQIKKWLKGFPGIK